MYAAVYCDDIVAVHDDIKVVSKFIEQQGEKQYEYKIIKIKKKRYDSINNIMDLDDLYLVRKGDLYYPFNLYQNTKHFDDESLYDLNFVKDILSRILEENELPQKERKAICKTILIVTRLTEEFSDIPYEILKDIADLNQQYHERICDNNE